MTIISSGQQYISSTIPHPYSQRFVIKVYLLHLSAETIISSLIDILSSCDSGMVDGPIEALLKLSALQLLCTGTLNPLA